jgi:hypothetical protein
VGSPEAEKFALHLWVHDRPSIVFEHNSSSYIMSHCVKCRCCVIRLSNIRKNSKRDHKEFSSIVCQKCKKEDRNTKQRIDYYKPEHGHASNSTTLESLLMLPNHMRLKARFEDRKRQVKTKDQCIKQLEDFH